MYNKGIFFLHAINKYEISKLNPNTVNLEPLYDMSFTCKTSAVITESRHEIWCHWLVYPISMMVTLRICVTWIQITLHVHMYRPLCMVFLDLLPGYQDVSQLLPLTKLNWHNLYLLLHILATIIQGCSSTTSSDGILFLYSADTDTLTDIIWIIWCVRLTYQ